jgi:hypothetical protein
MRRGGADRRRAPIDGDAEIGDNLVHGFAERRARETLAAFDVDETFGVGVGFIAVTVVAVPRPILRARGGRTASLRLRPRPLRRSAGVPGRRVARPHTRTKVAHPLRRRPLQHQGQAHRAGDLLKRLRRVPGPAGPRAADLRHEILVGQDRLFRVATSRLGSVETRAETSVTAT